MSIDDRGHRPHAEHFGEAPFFEFLTGPEKLEVTLDNWGPQDQLLATMFNALQANWGEEPSRVLFDSGLTPGQREFAVKAFQGKTLPQVLEGISFWFTINNVSRAFTHQCVRTRIGAGFMQHGGRDNDWRHRSFRIPETIHRACNWLDEVAQETPEEETAEVAFKEKHCLVSAKVLIDLENQHGKSLAEILRQYIRTGREIYSALVDAGIPWQDARRYLHIGSTTYIHATYNLAALRGVLANRLEHIMDWEINCVAQLMLRQVRMHCPDYIWSNLGSHSDLQGKAAMEHLDSWPPDGKWPCSEEAERTPRMHRREQMPFFVLTPDAMAGGPVRWIKTNGEYPQGMKRETTR